MRIHDMPTVLAWKESADALAAIAGAYEDQLVAALGKTLRTVTRSDPGICAAFDKMIHCVSEESFARFLTAPQTSYLLIWRLKDVDRNVRQLLDWLCIEALREGYAVHAVRPGWSATGDVLVADGRRVAFVGLLAGKIPVDFESPYASVVFEQANGRKNRTARLSVGESQRVLAALGEAMEGIRQTCESIATTVASFTKSLALLRDLDNPVTFSSGSRGQYIGATALLNPHTVDVEMLADALVHEATHSILYMQELLKPWVRAAELYNDIPRVVSPWSGRCLPVRAFLQACFVWYALTHFWCLAQQSRAFRPARVKRMIATSVAGFLAGSLSERVRDVRDELDDDILRAIDEMQRKIVDAYSGGRAIFDPAAMA